MCVKLYFIWFLLLWLCLSAAVLQGEQWYLITETELQSIERYRQTSEQEKRSWLLQVQGLKLESTSLNSQLETARAQNRKLEQSFNEYDKDQLTQLSLKNGEIAGLKQEREKYKGTAKTRLVAIIALAGSWILFIAYKIYRKFRPFLI